MSASELGQLVIAGRDGQLYPICSSDKVPFVGQTLQSVRFRRPFGPGDHRTRWETLSWRSSVDPIDLRGGTSLLAAFGTGMMVTVIAAIPLNIIVRRIPLLRYLGFPLAALAPTLLVVFIRFGMPSSRTVVWTSKDMAAVAGGLSAAILMIVVWWIIWVSYGERRKARS